MTKICAFAASKQAGKSSAGNFLVGMEMVSLGLMDSFQISDEGKLIVPTTDGAGIFDIVRPPAAATQFCADAIWPHIRIYNFGDALKEYTAKLYNLNADKLWGSDEEKNELTHILWERMPASRLFLNNTAESKKQLADFKKKSGPMSYRQILEYFGSYVMREVGEKNDAIYKILSEHNFLDYQIPDEEAPA